MTEGVKSYLDQDRLRALCSTTHHTGPSVSATEHETTLHFCVVRGTHHNFNEIVVNMLMFTFSGRNHELIRQ